MRGLVACLVVGALLATGCGSSDSSSSSKAPGSQQAAAKPGSPQAVAVSAQGRATPAALCQPQGVAKPKKQCVKGLKKLQKGKAKNPAAACKGLSKKKTKGVRGKSPYAVCVKAAARLMAAKKRPAKTGAADNSTATSTTDESEDSAADDPAPEDIEPV